MSAAASPRRNINTRCKAAIPTRFYKIAPELREKLATLPQLRDVDSDLYIRNPQMLVDVDREKAAVYGVTVDQVRQELYNAYGSRQVATILRPRTTIRSSSKRCRSSRKIRPICRSCA